MSEKSLPEAFDGTLDGLARIVLKGFEAAERDVQLFRAETEASFSRIELRLTEVPYRFELDELHRRVGNLEKTVTHGRKTK